ncbi:MAG: insulinase family protein [Alphaproteobacteria bacterium]|nr:insulinase family protein [Alphaproteobacteria bacterium]
MILTRVWRSRRLAAALVAGAALLAPAATGAEDAGFKAEVFELANGMEVVVLPDHRVPVVTHMVWYRIGSADERPGKSGIAHYLEHLMFKGTPRFPDGEFSKIVARNGGQDNASTSTDYTNYFQRVAKDRLPLVMEMEADRMKNLVLSDEVVLPERDVIIEERSFRTDNDPGSLLYEQMQAALYLNHPYGTPIIGWRREMEQLTREDALDWYRAHYAPDDAILIIAGDVTAEEVKPLAEKYYGPLAPSGVTRAERPQEPPAIAARRVLMEDKRVEQPQVLRLYLVPSYATGKDAAHALEVLSDILGGGDTSRLYRILVEEKKLAVSASTYFDGDSLDATTFSVSAIPAEGVTLEALEAAIDEILADFIANGPTEDEMTRAKTGLIANALYARDSQYLMARIYGSALVTGQTVEDVESWPARIAEVTPDAVKGAAAEHLVMKASVTGFLRAPQ